MEAGGYLPQRHKAAKKSDGCEDLLSALEPLRETNDGLMENQEELNRSYMNCMGWSQMVSALKAYVEYGIDLRKGAYGGLYEPQDHQGTAKA